MKEYYILDLQLQRFSALPEAIGIPIFDLGNDNDTLASDLSLDVNKVIRYARNEWPDIMDEINSPISIIQRYDALVGYFQLMQQKDPSDPTQHRAKIITQFYFDFVYFRNQILELLRKRIVIERRFGNVPHLTKWLELVGNTEYSTRLKALRNAFAHGNWVYFSDYSGIVCYDRMNHYEWTQVQLGIAHALLYTFQLVFFSVARNSSNECPDLE